MLPCLAPFRLVLLSQLSRVILDQFETIEVSFERALRLCRTLSGSLLRYDLARLSRTQFRLIRCDLSRQNQGAKAVVGSFPAGKSAIA